MRRIVRDRVLAALERERFAIEEYISRCLEYPLGFPFKLAPAAVLVREMRNLKVFALAKADLPPVRIEAVIKVWLSNHATHIRGNWDHPGILDADVALSAHGRVVADGRYDIDPECAALKSWWRDVVTMESERLPRR